MNPISARFCWICVLHQAIWNFKHHNHILQPWTKTKPWMNWQLISSITTDSDEKPQKNPEDTGNAQSGKDWKRVNIVHYQQWRREICKLELVNLMYQDQLCGNSLANWYNQLEWSLLWGPGLGLLWHFCSWSSSPPPDFPLPLWLSLPSHLHQPLTGHADTTQPHSEKRNPDLQLNHRVCYGGAHGSSTQQAGGWGRRRLLEKEGPLLWCQPGSHISVESLS